MSLSNQTVDELYLADGVQTSFAIPFAFLVGDILNALRVFIYDENGTPTEVTGGFTIYPDEEEPTHIVFDEAPAAGLRILVTRRLDLVQEADLNPNSFSLKTLEKALDRIVMLVQQVNALASRSLRISRVDGKSLASLVTLKGKAGRVPVVNETEDGFNLGIAGSGSGGSAVPDGGAETAVLEKATDADGDVQWSDAMVFSGFSQRFSQMVDISGLKNVIDWIMQITFAPPVITAFTGTGHTVLRERGDTVTNPTLSVTIQKRSDPVLDIAFYDGAIDPGNLIGSVITSGPAIPDGGTQTQATSVAFSANRTFRVRVRDDGTSNGGTPQNVDSALTYNFVYPYYHGVANPGAAASTVAAMTKTVMNNSGNVVRNFTAAVGNVFYFAYPASYGALTSILDENGFENLVNFTQRTENITGLDGNPVSYFIYEFNNPVGVSVTTQYTFRK
jgi:hypothetical protein